MTHLNEVLAEFARANAVKADALELRYTAHRMRLQTGGSPDEIAVRILQEFERRSIGNYQHDGEALIFETAGELFVIRLQNPRHH